MSPSDSPSTPRWGATTSEGDSWAIEIESDCFAEEDGLVVSVFVESVDPTENDGKPSYIVCQVNPQQAREMAAELIKVADHVERSVLTPHGWVEKR
jgi:hypothetical protein